MATARLRKTFQYPAENSEDDDTPGDLDEEEQEKLIAQLKREDEDRSELYKVRSLPETPQQRLFPQLMTQSIFLILPLVAALTFLPTLMASAVYQVRLTSLLCITSLLATAYTLNFVPIARSSAPTKRTLLTHPEPGPLHRYIELGNGALSLLLGFNTVIYKDRRGVHEAFWLLCLLPISCLFIIALARRLVISVDVEELEKLRYGYKGA